MKLIFVHLKLQIIDNLNSYLLNLYSNFYKFESICVCVNYMFTFLFYFLYFLSLFISCVIVYVTISYIHIYI